MELYIYRCQIKSVYDGDTVTALIDLGLGVHIERKVRLFGINAPELRGESKEDGLRSRDRLKELIQENENKLFIKTIKDKSGKYGRLLGVFYADLGVLSINQQLVDEGLAAKYDI